MILATILSAAAAAGPGSLSDIWQHVVADFSNLTDATALAAFGQVLLIDLVLAGDNAIVVGALAAGLPAADRRKVILIGIGAALVLRIFFALIVTWLMGIVGLIFAGGLLLLWVSWKFWREIREGGAHEADEQSGIKPAKSFAAAAWAVAVADVSMSLDNVLAVAGAAREHPGILVIGLLLSVALMGLAANFIARIINRHRWIAYIGLAVIVFVAGKMIYEGWAGTPETAGIVSLF
ncbi:YjbE family putative metal transport protein [Sphingomonas sp. RHCKR47]|uniref:YjbE family putative metal transport protein n=1 Tax=Sphingomonas citricola TaxID=2862498 RepID=UPI001CA598C6|nr:YjbE family putative metal transport protein [Sphingomonas citricola]MBW6524244.1 YjbE family putative metal transport protein [Sphingomonas citricola]